MTPGIDRRRFLWLCLGSAASACMVLTGCDGEVAAQEVVTQPTASTSAPAETETTVAPTIAPTATEAQEPVRPLARTCPRRMINDPYPGRCRLYVDKNGNGYCDLSQPA